MLSSGFSTIIFFFFFNDTATTEIYTLSLHDALPIYQVFQAVGRGLQQSLRAHAVRTEPILHPGTDASLGEREQGHAHHDRGEDHDDLDDRTDDEERHAGTPAPTLTRRPTSPTLA